MKRFADAELIGIFSDSPNVRDQQLANEQESSEALWQPLTRRNFEHLPLMKSRNNSESCHFLERWPRGRPS